MLKFFYHMCTLLNDDRPGPQRMITIERMIIEVPTKEEKLWFLIMGKVVLSTTIGGRGGLDLLWVTR